MTTTGYTKTILPARDWNERIWRMMLGQQVEISRGRMEGAQPAQSSVFASQRTRARPSRRGSTGGSKMSTDRAQNMGGEDRFPYSIILSSPPYVSPVGTRRGTLLSQGYPSEVLADFDHPREICPPASYRRI